MKGRALGRTDLSISPITFGAMAHGVPSRKPSEESRARALHAALDAGVNAIDTAPLYEMGGSEEMLGRALKDRRNQVILMSKVGLRWDDPHGRILFGEVRKNSRPESIRWEVERSLERLQSDHLDLCQIHHPDEDTPLADSLGALVDLRREGKIREIGVSNFSLPQLETARAALGSVPLASVQLEYNLIDRTAEKELLPWAREHQVGVLVHSPLYKGLLTGRIADGRTFSRDDFRGGLLGFQPENRVKINKRVASVLAPIAFRHGTTPASVALAFVIAQAGVVSAIAGASSAEQARENASAGDLVLSGLELLEIRAGFEAINLSLRKREQLKRLARRLISR